MQSIRNFIIVIITLLSFHEIRAQQNNITAAYLTRFKTEEKSSFTLPLTKYCFVREAGLSKEHKNGWIMKWEVVKDPNANLLFLEMNSTEIEGWMDNDQVSGSVQLVFELPAFTDSLVLTNLNYKSKGVHIINNYGGISTKKKELHGKLSITKKSGNIFISSSLDLVTKKPDTRQQITFVNNPVQSYTFDQYQAFHNQKDSLAEAERNAFVEGLTKVIGTRDSLWDIDNKRIADSLKLHPYTGKFRFWVSEVDKPGYSRTTYSISNDSLIIKKGPYDFIYLAANYPKDSIYFRRPLGKKEKALLETIERLVEADTLETTYTNFCIIDGSILSFRFQATGFSKDVTVSNYYLEKIAKVVEFINSISPKKYRLWYHKETLLKGQSECDK